MFRLRAALRQGIAAATPAPGAAAVVSALAQAPKAVTPGKLFDKILIANRGEIVLRVCKTARRLGIKTVAIYSEPDAHSMHVRAADEAVCVGPAASAKSYLNVPRIISAIESTGAQAVHPGYGFLSENAKFVSQLESRGITFIGPGATAMEALGDKINAKALAIAAGVRTVPGHPDDVPTAEEAVLIARDIGYPVIIKASSGGGGKGMRVAYTDDEVRSGFALSKEEARGAFASDSLLVEKFIEQPRHIEVQLIADALGNVVAFPERECTVQRRNQKVIEESPSPFLDAATRRAMQDQAAMLASSVGYVSAGTVEFLVDKHRNFYFLEMNTRLQVEHPVTEMVAGGVDLVELMLRVAAGERLPESLTAGGGRVPFHGHAFESRVYAEDPFRGFLPSIGRLSEYVEPQAFAAVDPYLALRQPDEEGRLQERLRADAGVVQGSEISMYYDPMICKLITHAPTRDDALDRMRAALDAYVIRGVGHNVSFLRELCAHPRFMAGDLTTAFIKEEYPVGFKGVHLTAPQRSQMVAAAALMNLARREAEAPAEVAAGTAAAAGAMPPPPPQLEVIVRLGGSAALAVAPGDDAEATAEAEGRELTKEEARAVEVAWARRTAYHVRIHTHEEAGSHGACSDASCADASDAAAATSDWWVAHITPHEPARGAPDGLGPATGPTETVRLANVAWEPGAPLLLADLPDVSPDAPRSEEMLRVQVISRTPTGFRLQAFGHTEDVTVLAPRVHGLSLHMLPKAVVDMSHVIASPMPGALVSLAVAVGDVVEDGQVVAAVDAMKMLNVLKSPRKGRVKAIGAKPGDTLAVDQMILEFEQPEQPASPKPAK